MATIKEELRLIRELLCFTETGKTGKINETASRHGYKQSNFSKMLKQLEAELKLPLLTRLSTGVVLTNDGKEIFEIASQFESILRKIKSYSTQSKTGGNLRLWVGDGLASGYISSCLPEFYLKYPKISIDICCSINNPNLIRESDIAILYQKPTNNKKFKISKQTLHFGLFAAPSYLSRYGYPQDLEDLRKNHFLCNRDNFTSLWSNWGRLIKSSSHIAVQTNSAPVLAQVIKDGLGIGLLPKSGYSEGLVELNKFKFNISLPFWIISYKDHQDSSVDALVNHIIESTKNL